MKNLITNHAKLLSIELFKEDIVDYVLIGSTLENDTTLKDLLTKIESNTPDYNIKDKASALYPFIISQPKKIASSTIDNTVNLIFTLYIESNDVTKKKFIHGICLLNKDGDIYTINRFEKPFNSINGSTEKILLKYAILTIDSKLNNKTKVISDNDAFVTRSEFSSYINDYKTNENYVTHTRLNHLLDEMDQVKLDNSVVGQLSDVQAINKSSVVNILNEIITNIGLLDHLTTHEKTSIVNALNSIKTEFGNYDELNIPDAVSVIDAVNKLYEIIKNKKTLFKDNIRPEDVKWSDKANVLYIGDIDGFNGKTRTTIIDALNEIYDLIGNTAKFHTITEIRQMTNYKLYDNTQDYKGTLGFKFFKADDIVFCFNMDLNIVPNSHKYTDVYVNPSILNSNPKVFRPHGQGYNQNLFKPYAQNYRYGFSICFVDNEVFLSISEYRKFDNYGKKIDDVWYDKIIIDYNKMNTNSVLEINNFSPIGSTTIKNDYGEYEDPNKVGYDVLLNPGGYTPLFNLHTKFNAHVKIMEDGNKYPIYEADFSSAGDNQLQIRNARFLPIDPEAKTLYKVEVLSEPESQIVFKPLYKADAT